MLSQPDNIPQKSDHNQDIKYLFCKGILPGFSGEQKVFYAVNFYPDEKIFPRFDFLL
jgi:hypothetical protein